MTDETESQVDRLLETPDLADALESDHFKHFLDHVPVAIAVAELRPTERIIYVNLEFERLAGWTSRQAEDRLWSDLKGEAIATDDHRRLGEAVSREQDYLGVFALAGDGDPTQVDVWSNVIRDDDGEAVFRLIALAEADRRPEAAEMERRLAEKDILLRELQHRVRNNLQMITALIRLEARNVRDTQGARFDRLAGRIEALSLLYDRMEHAGNGQTIDLGPYLSQIAAFLMAAHGVEGVHLDLAIDSLPASANVAMPIGLAVNELMTNALKHAFAGRDGGRMALECRAADRGGVVRVSDNGVGLAPEVTWPQPGKMGAMIVHALEQNAGATVEVASHPGKGVSVTIRFARTQESR
jgi:PAS domain S-box-containing protein